MSKEALAQMDNEKKSTGKRYPCPYDIPEKDSGYSNKKSNLSAYQFKDPNYTGHPDKPWKVEVKGKK